MGCKDDSGDDDGVIAVESNVKPNCLDLLDIFCD